MAPSRLELLAWVAVSIGVAAAVFAAQTPDILGLFHDDGVYAATAKSGSVPNPVEKVSASPFLLTG